MLKTENIEMENQILLVQNICKSFEKKQALCDVSFSLKKGSFTVIAGPNGSGKSVLMSLIAGLDEPDSGKIISKPAGLVFQDADDQILGETPLEDIAFSLRNLGLSKKERKIEAEKALAEMSLLEKKNLPSRSLSGGEKRRLAVAGILALKRDFFIFDEPFANLDFPGVSQVCNILKKLKSEGKTVIVLTHELEKILALADNFIILSKGKIVFNGTVNDGLSKNLEDFGIKNPFQKYTEIQDLFWGSKE